MTPLPNEIEGVVYGLKATVEAFQENWKEQDRRADEGRKILYEKMEGIGSKVEGLGHQVATVVREVTDMKPAVADWVATKNKAIGASGSARLMWSALGAIVVGIGWLLDHFLSIVPYIAIK